MCRRQIDQQEHDKNYTQSRPIQHSRELDKGKNFSNEMDEGNAGDTVDVNVCTHARQVEANLQKNRRAQLICRSGRSHLPET